MPPSVKPRAERASRSCIAIVTDHNDWHARELTRAFTTMGMKARLVKLSECSFSTSAATGLHIPGFNLLPTAVLVREVSGGTFEAVTRRLGILHALREHGVPVWSDARAIEHCVDKSMTTFLLAKAGLPTPPTWTVESKDQGLAIVRRETSHGPLVLKPLFGSQGRGLRLIHSESDLPDPSSVAGVYYLQRFAGVERDSYRDFRLLVSGRRLIAAMARHAPTWITNVKQGGRPMVAFVDAEMKRLAIEAAACVGADFAGVDLLFGADGRPLIIEVNSMPAWSGLQKVTEANIADRLASDLVRAIEGQGMRETAR